MSLGEVLISRKSRFRVVFFVRLLSIPSCFASFAELGPLPSPFFVVQFPHVPSPTVCFVSVSLFASFLFLLLPSISIDVGATTGVFTLFSTGFLLCDHGLDF